MTLFCSMLGTRFASRFQAGKRSASPTSVLRTPDLR
jgi:hypothetical protein